MKILYEITTILMTVVASASYVFGDTDSAIFFVAFAIFSEIQSQKVNK